MRYVWPALAVLFALQTLEGTQVVTSVAFCAFILVITDAFNAVGGLVYPSGAYIFFLGFLSVILGGLAKTVVGESLDSHLYNTQKDLLIYLTGACSIWVAARISAATRRKKPFLLKTQLTSNITQATVGALLVGQFGMLLVPESYVSTFNQMNQLLYLAVILAAYDVTKRTDGRRSFSVLALGILLLATAEYGLFSFSKQGMFTPSLCWALGATMAGYRMTWKRALFVGTFAFVMATLLTPISQIGRAYRYLPDANEKAIELLMHPLETRDLYNREEKLLEDKQVAGYHWFEHTTGLLDRLTVLPIDDALIHRTDRGYSPGSFPIVTYATNMIPRYLVKEKPLWRWGNRYAHEIGLLGKDDFVTGISFTPFADLYHCLQWWGVSLVCLPVYVIFFWVCDSVTGSIHDTIWASIYILLFSHNSAEGMFWAPFNAVSVNTFMVVALAVLGRYILPILGGLFIPVSRKTEGEIAATAWRPAAPLPLTFHRTRTIEEKL